MSSETPEPAPPTVSADVYDEDYYRGVCAGHAEWSDSDGADIAGLYPGILHLAGFQSGEVVLDIGAGRGELVAVAAEQGAARAIGFDYSSSAVELAQQTLRARDVADRAEVRQADVRSMPLDDASIDLVTMIDVVEHLSPAELHDTFVECLRVLRPGGRVFVHTMPNRTVYEVTYRLHRLAARAAGRRWPVDPRNDYERAMHVNEQSIPRLRRALRAAGYSDVEVSLGDFVYTDFVPGRHKRLYHWLARHRVTARLGRNDIFGKGVRPLG